MRHAMTSSVSRASWQISPGQRSPENCHTMNSTILRRWQFIYKASDVQVKIGCKRDCPHTVWWLCVDLPWLSGCDLYRSAVVCGKRDS